MTRAARIAALALPIAAAAAGLGAHEAPERGSRTLRETFDLAAGAGCRVAVDTVSGDVEVAAHPAGRVEMVAVETIRARTPEDAAQARSEVRLEATGSGGVVDLYVDGPFRDPHDRRRTDWRRYHRGYEVIYDFTLKVPEACDLDLKTVNRGEIRVAGVRGDFTLRNVNGGIEVEGADGSGEATTVNGGIRFEFLRGPRAATRFETVNGDLVTRFPDDLDADLDVATRYGEVWSDFDLAPLAPPPATRSRRGDLLVIQTGRGASFRVGRGGPRISYETLNGDIVVQKTSKGR